MKWMRNLKIRVKLIMSFALVTLLTILVSSIAIYAIMSVDKKYSDLLANSETRYTLLLQLDSNIIEIRRITGVISIYADDAARVNSEEIKVASEVASAKDIIQQYNDNVDKDSSITDKSERKQTMMLISNHIDSYYNDITKPIFVSARGYDLDGVNFILTSGASIIDNLSSEIESLLEIARVTRDEISDASSEFANYIVLLQIIISSVSALISIMLAFGISALISKPIVQLVGIMEDVAEGKLNVNINVDRKDETGILSKSLSHVVTNVNNIISDIDKMYKNHEDGKMDSHIDPKLYNGSYREVAVGVNNMVDSYIDMLEEIFATLEALGNGSFDTEIKQYKGDKAILNKEIDSLLTTIRRIVSQINMIVSAGQHGNLSERADATSFKGQWAEIVNGLNEVLNAISQPISEAQSIIIQMSKGDFNSKVTGNYKGDFLQIKNALNFTVDAISSYITEINDVLFSISNGDLTVGIRRDYVGQFLSIKDSINSISTSLNNTMSEINASSEQVLMGSKQISQSAMMLAQGATEQASSVQELTASVDEIDKQAMDNAKNAQIASTLSEKSKSTAEEGNAEMKELLVAMEGIKVSSNKISNIIKVIEEIATQTNLLALNAAVEAARAGEHGKGFTVVAGAVRDLAIQSQDAAKETSQLIRESISRVSEGTDRANQTAGSLEQIMTGALEVSDVIKSIYDSSVRQSEAIGNVGIGLNQISQVVQSNSATSQQSAAASEELNSQAETLQSMVAFFKIN